METKEEHLKRKARALSISEGSAYSVMDGFGLRNIIPFALALGKGNPKVNAYVGFLSSFPSLLGFFSQIFSSKLIENHSRKKIVLFSVFLQALMWLGLILLIISSFYFSLNSHLSLLLLLAVYTLIVVFGAFAGPAWASWMRDIVTKDSGKYFGKRNKICGAVALSSMLLAGFFLDYIKGYHLFFGFAVLFFFSFLFRGISGFFFTKKFEPELKLNKDYYFTFRQFARKMKDNNFGRFTLFISLMTFATAIAAPFFSVYMLNQLHFTYFQWTVAVISSSLSTLFFMPVWGKFTDRFGNLSTLKICGFFLFFVPLLWLLSPLLSGFNLLFYIILVELFAGFVWSGFNLSSSTFIYQAVSRQRMAICSAYHNFFIGIGTFAGASIGGIIASLHFNFLGLNSILFLFLLSALVRAIIYFTMFRSIKEVREVEKFNIEKQFSIPLILENFNLKYIKPLLNWI